MTLRGDLSDSQKADEVTYTAQIASTIARLLGLNWQSAKPNAADPIKWFLPQTTGQS